MNHKNTKCKTINKYAAVQKQIEPPFNPGVRQWCCVDPEKQVVDCLDYLPDNVIPNPPGCKCNYIDPLIEKFSINKTLVLDSTNIIRILIIVLIIYLIWYYFIRKNK